MTAWRAERFISYSALATSHFLLTILLAVAPFLTIIVVSLDILFISFATDNAASTWPIWFYHISLLPEGALRAFTVVTDLWIDARLLY